MFVKATCGECGETFEAPEEYVDLVVQGAQDCAEADREWRGDLLDAMAGVVA